MDIKLALNVLKLKGYLSYEYNPFHNYKTSVDLFKVKDIFIVPRGMAVNTASGRLLNFKGKNSSGNSIWEDEFGLLYLDNDINIIIPKEEITGIVEKYADAGSLIDLDTDKLNFDLEHPVDITVQPSYDGSVNLILNDGKNIPRLINSRFSVREKNTYEIVDRIGENDTNVYSDNNFDKDSSLYFLFGENPIIKFNGYVQGVLSVGLYCLYVTYCDSDDNESDYIAESGLIPIFKGTPGLASSMDGGIKNEDSNKGISITLRNLDKSYNYIKIYYVRYFADYQLNRVYEGKKISKKFPINSSYINILITGHEESEDFDPNILNISKFNPKSVLTQALCKNMLFFGNIVLNSDNYKELLDCALRIIPRLVKNSLEKDFPSITGYNGEGYYNSDNIYNKVGYMNLEFYRFGVVFIYNNGTLSNVYNTTGCILNYEEVYDLYYKEDLMYELVDEYTLKRKYIQTTEDGWISNPEIYLKDSKKFLRLNSKGVCKINSELDKIFNYYGINFEIPDEVINFLKNNLGIRGLFFVRLKRIPHIIAQCFLMPIDDVLLAPVIHSHDDWFIAERFINSGTVLTNNYDDHKYGFLANLSAMRAYAAICPDFLLNLPYYNQIFNNSEFYLELVLTGTPLIQSGRHYYTNNSDYNASLSKGSLKKVNICSVTEDVPTVAIKDKIYRLNIGEATEAFRFRSIGTDNTSYNTGSGNDSAALAAFNLCRGIFSPYLAVYSETPLDIDSIYNIYSSTTNSELLEFLTRMDNRDAFYAISDRYNFEKLSKSKKGKYIICYRGDCYINLFTYRLNRNFNDPTLPNNDTLIDPLTWNKYYVGVEEADFSKIIRSDVNAVLLGLWITFRVRSSFNYALRSLDHSYVSEEAIMKHPRTYFPRNTNMHLGDFKMPDSYLYNDAYRATLGFKAYYDLPDINYIKNTFSNRIQYSAIAILDSFKNNYRDSLSTYFRDYSTEYGGITKLVELNGNLIVVFEHAIGLAIVNERILAGASEGDPVFINTKNVLPQELTILTDTYGSLWTESVIKSEAGFIYGVDTIAKKIWRIKGLNIELISDFKVNKFLNENISLGERENTPIIGLKNVKTHYNNNKKDIMFTFYDNTYEDEEKVWNLCFNELLNLFITFYSWVPSYSENIDTLYFTFNRNSSKIMSLLGLCNYHISSNKGILLDTPILRQESFNTLIQHYIQGIREGSDISGIELKLKTLIKDNPLELNTLTNIFESIKEEKELVYKGFSYINKSIYAPNTTENIGDIFPITSAPITVNNEENISYEVNLGIIDTITIYEIEDINHVANFIRSNYLNNILYTLEVASSLISNLKDKLQEDSSEKLTQFISKLKEEYFTYLYYRDNISNTRILNEDGTISNQDENIQSYDSVQFRLEKDHWLNYKLFEDILENSNVLKVKNIPEFENRVSDYGYILLNISAFNKKNEIEYPLTTLLIILTTENVIKQKDFEGNPKQSLTTDFYLHGKAGIFNVSENLYPTYWYGEYHPFEFEFVVNDKIAQLKVFTNLIMISNKAEPESFHFEIEGDNYEFSSDKRAMYVRQEATKELYLNLGSDILFNRQYYDVVSSKYTKEQSYRARNNNYMEQYSKMDRVYPIYQEGLIQLVKSTIFPLYYEKIDTYNDIYHKYHMMHDNDGIYDFQNLSGSEITWDRDLNQFNIITHIKNRPIDLVGRLRGNSFYKEGSWNVQIPSITFMLKNESEWNSEGKKIPPIVINSQYVPKDLNKTELGIEDLPNIYTGRMNSIDKEDNTQVDYSTDDPAKYIDTSTWTARKETKIRDKWIKIRIRYSGKNLAVIHSLITLYNISYS